MNRVVLNESSYFGRGSRKKLIDELIDRQYKKAFIVTDTGIIKSGVLKETTDILDNINFHYDIYSEVKPNPTVENVVKGVYAFKNSEADVIIAVGGGSTIDTSKAISIISKNPEHIDVVSLDGAKTKNKGTPIIAIPTTSGTAAEVTMNYVITDTNRKKKMVIVDTHSIPIVSIIDGELMEKMPKDLAAWTGMDALTHAMEGYLNKNAWIMTDMYHLNAMALITKNLENAVLKKDKEAIDSVALGQYIAGMGFSNSGLGIVHSMAHALGAVYDTPHGLANAMLLPYVMKYNGYVCPDLFRNMGRAMGMDMKELRDKDAVNKVVEKVYLMARHLEIPKTLREIGVKEEDIPLLAQKAYDDVCTPGNVRKASVEDIERLYKEMY